MIEALILGAGVNALLDILKSQAQRKKYARVLIKLFVAIKDEIENDVVLQSALRDKLQARNQ